ELGIWEDIIYVDYWIAVGDMESLHFYPLIDTDGNGTVSEEEKEYFLEGLEKDIISRGIRLVLDEGTSLSFALYSSRIILEENKNAPVPIKINFEFLVDLERLRSFGKISDKKEYPLTFYITNILNKSVFLKLFIAQGEGINIIYTPQQRTDSLIFRSGFWLKPDEATGIQLDYQELEKKSSAPAHFNRYQKTREDSAKQKLGDYLKSDELSVGVIIIALLLSFLYGAGHALTPGHGKTLVAAYLVGSRGTVLQAILLGLVVTATHLATVIIAGLLALVGSHYINQTAFSCYLGIASGLIIIIMGIYLFRSRLTRPALSEKEREEHHHHHPDVHRGEHSHSAPPLPAGDMEKVSLKHLLILGMSGGLVPCPTAIVVLLMAITLKKTLWGLFLILAFSLGLASVLIVIGVLMVTGLSFIKPTPYGTSSRTAKLIRALSIISSVVIILVGKAIIISNLINSGVIILNLKALP
ncbi:MAG: sulfite exporter TauE/SafE family protein, partial [Planctomycetota bacterium]|nr:sulfite exporter TauE/SafE family protein [Planctomycetota bacterium]